MKMTLIILAVFVILFFASILYAETLRVMVMPFEGDSKKEEGLAKKASIICAQEVMASKNFIYVAPSDGVKAVINGEKITRASTVDLNKEYSTEKTAELKKILDDPKYAPDKRPKPADAVDAAIGSSNVHYIDDKVSMDVVIATTKGYKSSSADIECEEGRLEEELRKETRRLLKEITD